MLYKIFLAFAVAQLCAARNISNESPHLGIIGGREVIPHSAPYMVFLVFKRNDPKNPDLIETCGGTLITKQHVLTAAHCFVSPNTLYFILAGAHNITVKERTRQILLPDKHVIHPYYHIPKKYANDLAIVKLKKPVIVNKNVRVVTLPTAKDARKKYVGQKATVYGWGTIHDKPNDVDPNVLMKVDINVMSNAACLKKAPRKDVYFRDLCTDGAGTKGACFGDSGGPLMLNGVQIGVVSRGATAYCEKNYPTIFVRVTSYVKWIQDTIKSLK